MTETRLHFIYGAKSPSVGLKDVIFHALWARDVPTCRVHRLQAAPLSAISQSDKPAIDRLVDASVQLPKLMRSERDGVGKAHALNLLCAFTQALLNADGPSLDGEKLVRERDYRIEVA